MTNFDHPKKKREKEKEKEKKKKKTKKKKKKKKKKKNKKKSFKKDLCRKHCFIPEIVRFEPLFLHKIHCLFLTNLDPEKKKQRRRKREKKGKKTKKGRGENCAFPRGDMALIFRCNRFESLRSKV